MGCRAQSLGFRGKGEGRRGQGLCVGCRAQGVECAGWVYEPFAQSSKTKSRWKAASDSPGAGKSALIPRKSTTCRGEDVRLVRGTLEDLASRNFELGGEIRLDA